MAGDKDNFRRFTIDSIKNIFFALALLIIFVDASPVYAASLADRLSGRFLIQIEHYGESWWVHPRTRLRYYLGRPQDAFNLMRAQGIGISNKDIEKIPLIGSTAPVDRALVDRLKGNIVLQVESRGEAWYINPVDGMRFYLGRPADALAHMRNLGLGIKDSDLNQIRRGDIAIVARESSWKIGEVYQIEWVNAPKIFAIDIERVNDGSLFFITGGMEARLPQIGVYQWTIPQTFLPGKYRLILLAPQEGQSGMGGIAVSDIINVVRP